MATTARPKIFTHLWYATAAEEAAQLYASIFPDSGIDRVWALPTESPSGPAGSVKVDAGMSTFSGVVKADTVIANSVVGTSYTPGAGNIW